MKRTVKILVDTVMFLLFLYLLRYRPGMGLLLHAVGGIALFVLFIVHHLLNMRWYKTLFKGKYAFRRSLLTVSDFLLFFAMLGMMISSVMLSGMVFNFSPIQMTQGWRDLHLLFTAWGFVLTDIHLGLHLHSVMKKASRKISQTPFAYVYSLLLFLTAGFGVYCFAQSELYTDMFLITGQPQRFIGDLQFYIEYGFITLAVSVIVHGVLWVTEKAKSNKNKNIEVK